MKSHILAIIVITVITIGWMNLNTQLDGLIAKLELTQPFIATK